MAYGANILKKEAAYYSLQNASIRNGILHINAGGYATQQISISDLPKITDTLQFTCIVDEYSDRYINDTVVLMHARMAETQEYYNAFLFPVPVMPNKYECIFKLAAGEYDEMYVTISSKHTINFTLWELCPVAASEEVETIIDGVKQSLPRLLYDYNTWPLTVEDVEATVGLITFRLIDKTDLQGHFIMSFFASEATILTVRFYTNGIEELFAPLTYDIRKGYNSIGIPHCYLHRSAGFYSVMATAQVSAGIVTIPTRGVLYSIDGGYLAKRELDVAMDVQDLAIRQTSISYGPDEVWLIGIDAGEILVRKRDYNEINPNVAWTPVLSLGNGIAAAMEFNGYWNFRVNSMQYTIETEEEPWYFWVDTNGALWGRHGTDEATLFQLDSSVSLVRACRGYKSEQYLDQDQGLVVVYLKDGIPWYCQYIWDNFNKVFRWTLPELLLLSDETWEQISVTRLNDYRLAFSLSNAQHNVWLYTDRTYVNNAVPHENVYSPSIINFYPVAYLSPPVDETLNVLHYEAEVGDTQISFTLDHIIAFPEEVFDLHDLLSFTGLIWNKNDWEHKNDVLDVEMSYDEEHNTTTFLISLTRPIPYTAINIYVNRDSYAWVRKKLDTGIFISSTTPVRLELNFFPQLTDTLEGTRLAVTSPGIQYLGKRVVENHNNNDEVIFGEVQLGGLHYSEITITTHVVPAETVSACVVSSYNLEYIQVGHDPI